MLIVAMAINEGMVNSCGIPVLLIVTVLITGGNVTWVVFQFKTFAIAECPENSVFMIINICVGVLSYVIVYF